MANVSANDILNVAKSYIGTKESPPNSNRVIFNTEYYGKVVSGSSYPWCLVFVWYVFKKAGASALFYDGQKCAYTPTMANWFRSKGRFYATPKVGDLVFFQFPSSNRINHVGIVIEILGPNKIKTIEGNTSVGNDSNGGAVLERVRSTSSVKGYGRPEYGTEVENKATKEYTHEDFVKDVQTILNVPVTGKGNEETFRKTVTIGKKTNNKHPLVVPLQKYFKALGLYKGNIDGYFYTLSEDATKRFQSQYMKHPDGVIDAYDTTWKKLLKL